MRGIKHAVVRQEHTNELPEKNTVGIGVLSIQQSHVITDPLLQLLLLGLDGSLGVEQRTGEASDIFTSGHHLRHVQKTD